MTQNERMVWAAAYGAEYIRMMNDEHRRGDTAEHVPFVVERAWSAVVEMREARAAVAEGWGQSSDVFTMLEEMCSDR